MAKPLTKAELEALGKDARWDSRYGERAIAELRELREQNAALVAAHAECEAIIEHAEAHARSWKDEYNKEFDKCAALVAEIQELKERLEHAHDYPNHNALARVRSAEAATDCTQVGNGGMHSEGFYDDGCCQFCGRVRGAE